MRARLYTGVGSSEAQDHITAFTEELLHTGLWLADAAADLVEALPPDA